MHIFSFQNYDSSAYVCPSTGGSKVIGSITLPSNSSQKLADSSGRITKVTGKDRYSEYSDVYLGTDKGTISKVNTSSLHYTITNFDEPDKKQLENIMGNDDKVLTSCKLEAFSCYTFNITQNL